MEKLTKQRLQQILDSSSSVEDCISVAWKMINKSNPKPPQKPIIKKDMNSEEALAYANNLAFYEKQRQDWLNKELEFRGIRNDNKKVLRDFIEDQAGIFNVPEQYRDKLCSKGWDMTHSYGYCAYYQKLCELIEIFE
jgi:hypothetical protein